MTTPKTKPVTKTPAAVPTRPNLDSFQLMLTDLFTELVTHGDSDSADVENLLYALFSAQQGRYRGTSEEAMLNWKNRFKSEWLRKFKAARCALPTLDLQKKAQMSLTEEVRASRRRALLSDLQPFLETAAAEEVNFLYEVMNTWFSIRARPDGEPGEVYIASAFQWVLSRPGYFFNVPEWAQKAVEEHLEWLVEQREKLMEAA